MNFAKFGMFLNGKKTFFGLACLFVYGGLSYVGVELNWLKDLGTWITALGAAHKLAKLEK